MLKFYGVYLRDAYRIQKGDLGITGYRGIEVCISVLRQPVTPRECNECTLETGRRYTRWSTRNIYMYQYIVRCWGNLESTT